ncbi:adenylate/guanylate cyclase domain-containing protein [Endozoicomonas numazuensis]|uniref:adenylate/guanylate cyclase domain-containing protein n=1 Tax=Endozoicomonas numazuensis TaxID=1137799 RepID=UPI00068DC488|nr:adenylate/guanylate cyclase domain-containing protein [Endozoicomonas numazuensis]
MAKQAIFSSLHSPVGRDYQARVLAYTLVALSIGFGIYKDTLPSHMIFFGVYAAVYPHIATLLFFFLNQLYPKKHKPASLVVDSMNAGIFLIAAGLPPVESMLFSMILMCSGIIRYGLISLAVIPVLMLASGGVTYFLLPQPLMRPMPVTFTLVSALSVMIYMLYLAWIIRQKHKVFVDLRDKAKAQQRRYTILASSLTKYLSPQVWHSIFVGRKSAKLESQRKKLTVFFSDIKGFTELSEELEPEALTDMLNQYLTEMSKIALKYGGTIDKFVGDSIMIFFGDPRTRGPKKDALAAVSMAIAMRRHMKVLRHQWRKQGIERPLEIRMGINTGYCTVGNFGAENRMDYTLIGKEVNLASRLESQADANQVLISHETWSLVKEVILCQSVGVLRVKGFSRSVPCYRVLDFRRNLGQKQSYMDYEAKGFSIYVDGDTIDHKDRKEIIRNLKLAAQKLEREIMTEDNS